MTGPTMNLLWSYVYARKMALDEFLGGLRVPRLRFFADSGAHSARTLGIDLRVDDYATWLVKWSQWMTIYANLDVIGAPQRTRDNQNHLEQAYGLHPMPVYHTGEPVSVLEGYIADGYTYIALGKLLGNPYARLKPWLDRAFRVAGDAAVFHGFGLTVWDALRRYPFYSTDSSSWGAGVRYGSMRLFYKDRWVPINLRSRADVDKYREVLNVYRLPWRALTKEHYDRELVAGACAAAIYRANAYLRRIHGTVTLPPGKGYPPGGQVPKVAAAVDETCLHTYLADSWDQAHAAHAGGLHMYLADAAELWTRYAAGGIGKEDPACG